MVDLQERDKGNISLPARLQSPQVLETEEQNGEYKTILNMQKALYDIKIEDTLKRIKRLEERNDELLDWCETTTLSITETDAETGDQITQLKRQLLAETEKVEEHKKRLEGVKKSMTEEMEAHLRKVDSINEKFRKTHLELTSEIKVLNAKINTLEDYKSVRASLKRKLKDGDDLLKRMNEELKEKLEEIERKFKTDRKKLKLEMNQRLLELAGTFQIEVANCVAKPIHRLMRENIIMKNELIQTAQEALQKKRKGFESEIMIESYQNQLKDGQGSHTRDLITGTIQGKVLKVVKDTHDKLKDIVSLNRPSSSDNTEKQYEALIATAEKLANERQFRLNKLQVLLHREKVKLNIVKYSRNKLKAEAKRCWDVLYDVKYAATCALQRTGVDREMLEMNDRQLMSYLLSIISKSETEVGIAAVPSIESVLVPRDDYQIEDLGFEPEHVDLGIDSAPSEFIVEQEEPAELSTFEILKKLGVRLSRKSLGYNESRIGESTYDKDIKDAEYNEESSEESSSTTKSDEEEEEEEEEAERVEERESVSNVEEEEAEGNIEEEVQESINLFQEQDESIN